MSQGGMPTYYFLVTDITDDISTPQVQINVSDHT
jgi:hypothetical protein